MARAATAIARGAVGQETDRCIGAEKGKNKTGETVGPSDRQTLRMMFLRYSAYRIPYQKRTNARAKARDAFTGLSHEAKRV